MHSYLYSFVDLDDVTLGLDRYMPIPSFRQRTQFLIHVQVPVLESYHSRILSSLDAFETLSSALVRAVPGALGVDTAKTDSRRLTGGVEGTQRLCKALLSARYIENTMKAWGEEVVCEALLLSNSLCSLGLLNPLSSFSWSFGLRSIVAHIYAPESENIPLFLNPTHDSMTRKKHQRAPFSKSW